MKTRAGWPERPGAAGCAGRSWRAWAARCAWLTALSSAMSTPSSIVGEQNRTGSAPAAERLSSRSSRSVAGTWAVCSLASHARLLRPPCGRSSTKYGMTRGRSSARSGRGSGRGSRACPSPALQRIAEAQLVAADRRRGLALVRRAFSRPARSEDLEERRSRLGASTVRLLRPSGSSRRWRRSALPEPPREPVSDSQVCAGLLAARRGADRPAGPRLVLTDGQRPQAGAGCPGRPSRRSYDSASR